MRDNNIDFQAAREKVRASDTRFQAKLNNIAQRDTEFQIARANRGGQMTSSLTDEAEVAAATVIRARDAARADLIGPVARGSKAVRDEKARKTLESARTFLAHYEDLRRYEHERNQFLALARQAETPIATGNENPADFIQRAERLMNPPTPARETPRSPLRVPDFAEFIAG
jgi:hypothetical protein